MKYQVMLNNTQVLSTHKSRDLAEKALKRWMKKHDSEIQAHNDKVSWIDSKLCRSGGMYHVKASN
jgi:hypothetical protein